MPFSPPKHTPTLRILCALLLIGSAVPASANAEDSPQPTVTDTQTHTSWADSVRAALARRTQRLKHDVQWTQQGVASWYGRQFQGRRTSSGEVFNTNALTAAHRTLPIGTKLKVVSEETGRSVIVTVNDRGPFNSRVIDLSHAAASQIGMLNHGTAHVKIARLTSADEDENPTEVADAGADLAAPTATQQHTALHHKTGHTRSTAHSHAHNNHTQRHRR